jgi:hypothetical protein
MRVFEMLAGVAPHAILLVFCSAAGRGPATAYLHLLVLSVALILVPNPELRTYTSA